MKTDGGYLVQPSHPHSLYPPWEKKALLGAPQGESSQGALIRMAVIVFHHRAPVSAKYGVASRVRDAVH